MALNTRFQFVMVYTAPAEAKAQAVADITTALAAGAIRVGEDAGLPLHTYPLAETAAAHQGVQDAIVGKVLVDVTA
jgi:NADPH2:quinone reductase